MNPARRLRFCALQEDHIGSVDPDALKIPARRAEYSLAESALSPVQAQPAQIILPRCPQTWEWRSPTTAIFVSARKAGIAIKKENAAATDRNRDIKDLPKIKQNFTARLRKV